MSAIACDYDDSVGVCCVCAVLLFYLFPFSLANVWT